MIRDLTALTLALTTLTALVLCFARPQPPAAPTPPAPLTITVDAPEQRPADDCLWLNPDLTTDAT